MTTAGQPLPPLDEEALWALLWALLRDALPFRPDDGMGESVAESLLAALGLGDPHQRRWRRELRPRVPGADELRPHRPLRRGRHVTDTTTQVACTQCGAPCPIDPPRPHKGTSGGVRYELSWKDVEGQFHGDTPFCSYACLDLFCDLLAAAKGAAGIVEMPCLCEGCLSRGPNR